MGFFKWIKDQYYDFQLKEADDYAMRHNKYKASEIYTSLLGKHDLAVVKLAQLLRNTAQTERELLDNLNELIKLKKFLNLSNNHDYFVELEGVIDSISDFADHHFYQGEYLEAINLIVIILVHRNNTPIQDRFHKYKAYAYYKTCKESSYQSCSYDIKNIVDQLNQVSTEPTAEVKEIYSFFVQDAQYARAIKFLLAFERQDLFNDIIDCAVQAINGNDQDIHKIDNLRTLFPEPVCFQVATTLSSLAVKAAEKLDFETAVSYDTLAEPYIIDNNTFNYNRCYHIINKIRPAANAVEIKSLLDLVNKLKLSENQVNVIHSVIKQIATETDERKAILICRLFPKHLDFGKIYIEKAIWLCRQGKIDLLNYKELLSIIRYDTENQQGDQDRLLADRLIDFVPYVDVFDNEYYDAALHYIIKTQDKDQLKRYWNVKPNVLFFKRLISSEISCYALFVDFIIENHSIFLTCDCYKESFCQALNSFNKEKYVLEQLTELINKKCSIEKYYSKIVIDYAKQKDQQGALALINQALTVTHEPTLISAKKVIIWDYIRDGQYSQAIKETLTLTDFDSEAWTLLADCYFTHAKNETDVNEQVALFQKVIELSENHALASYLQPSIDSSLEALSTISTHFHESGEMEKAYTICQSLTSQKVAWLNLFTSLRARDYKQLTTIGQKINHIEQTIASIKETLTLDFARSFEQYNKLWVQLSQQYIIKAKSQPYSKAIESLDQLLTSIKDNCDSAINSEEPKISKLIAELTWQCAIELELDCNFEQAITYYERLANKLKREKEEEALFRIFICKVKAKSLNQNDELAIPALLGKNTYKDLRNDLAFRYACFLIESDQVNEARTFIKKFQPEETGLLDICEKKLLKKAESCLAEFNQEIERLRNEEMTWSEAAAFYKKVDLYATQITPYLTDLKPKFTPYKSLLKRYIIKALFAVEDYARAFAGIMRWYSIDNYNHYRNLAIAAIGIIESDINDSKTIKNAISTALSAIYTDQLFVNSLEHTEWDDSYMFTLKDSLGTTTMDDYDTPPDNICDEEPIDNKIIAIADVQTALLNRIETAIRFEHPSYESFYNEEKTALEELLSLRLDKTDFVIATPGFASIKADIQASIKEVLDYEYKQEYDNQEDVLAVGLKYGFTGDPYSSYLTAKNILSQCLEGLTNHVSATKIASCFGTRSIQRIANYSKLFAELRSACSTSISQSISSEMDFKKFIDFYEPICQALKDIQISMRCANYINSQIVPKLNNNSFQLREGISYMVRAYKLAPSNAQVKENLEGILKNLIHEAEQRDSQEDRKAVEVAINSLNGEFDTTIRLTKIIAEFENKRIKEYSALIKLYELYKNNRYESEVCETLVAVAIVCIRLYLFDPNSSSSIKNKVREVLSDLCQHKSSTFKEHAKLFAKVYINILTEVPEDSRVLLVLPSNELVDRGLNEKGRALKEGLNFLKDLGEIDLLSND